MTTEIVLRSFQLDLGKALLVKVALVSGEGQREGRQNMQVIVVSPLVQIMQEQAKDLISQIVNRL